MKNLDVLVRQFLDLSFVANLNNQNTERNPEVSSLGPTEQASQAPRIALAQTKADDAHFYFSGDGLA